MKVTPKEYLGDGVYIGEREDGELVIYTSNGVRDENHIVLDLHVLKAMAKYLRGFGL